MATNSSIQMDAYVWLMDLVFPGTSDSKWYDFSGFGITGTGGANYVPWHTFTLTHIDYPDGDLFAKALLNLAGFFSP